MAEVPAKIEEMIQPFKRYIRWAILLLFVIFMAWLILKFIRMAKRPANATYVPGAPVPIGWDPTSLTKELFDVIDGTLVSSARLSSAFSKFNELNDNQMIDVYNKWLEEKYDQEKKYFMFPYGSLTNAVKDKAGYISIGAGENEQDVMLANLKRLHLD